MMKRLAVSLMVFAVVMTAGFALASRKLLWSDELLTQSLAIDRLSYSGILSARISEGNNSPLFYLLQKAVCQIAGYRLPVDWQGEFCVYEPRGQLILRILPAGCMALAAALLFYYCAWRGSMRAGLAAVAVLCTYAGFWVFLPEARPYSLWFLLALCQGIAFLEILRAEELVKARVAVWGWSLCNWLMALTVIFSFVPILATAAGLLYVYRRRVLPLLLPAAIGPVLVCWCYYFLSRKLFSSMQAVLPQDPAGIGGMMLEGVRLALSSPQWLEHIYFNVPPYWLVFLMIALAGSAWLERRGDIRTEGSMTAGLNVMMAAMAIGAVVLACLMLGWGARKVSAVAERYWLFLSPTAILVTVVLGKRFFLLLKDDLYARCLLAAVFLGLFAANGMWSLNRIMNWGPFWSL